MLRFFWYLGKGLQVLAMLVVGVALILGLSSTDAFTELKSLVTGVLVFLLGTSFVKFCEARS